MHHWATYVSCAARLGLRGFCIDVGLRGLALLLYVIRLRGLKWHHAVVSHKSFNTSEFLTW